MRQQWRLSGALVVFSLLLVLPGVASRRRARPECEDFDDVVVFYGELALDVCLGTVAPRFDRHCHPFSAIVEELFIRNEQLMRAASARQRRPVHQTLMQNADALEQLFAATCTAWQQDSSINWKDGKAAFRSMGDTMATFFASWLRLNVFPEDEAVKDALRVGVKRNWDMAMDGSVFNDWRKDDPANV